MFLHTTSTSTGGGAERLILEGRMKLLQCEFWVVEKNHITSGFMGQPLCHLVTILIESSWLPRSALQFTAIVFRQLKVRGGLDSQGFG